MKKKIFLYFCKILPILAVDVVSLNAWPIIVVVSELKQDAASLALALDVETFMEFQRKWVRKVLWNDPSYFFENSLKHISLFEQYY